MKSNYLIIVAVAVASLLHMPLTAAENYTIAKTGIFSPQSNKVLLLQDPTSQKKIILFQTNLRVNTDGSSSRSPREGQSA
jgi:hypothetical protein